MDDKENQKMKNVEQGEETADLVEELKKVDSHYLPLILGVAKGLRTSAELKQECES